MKKQPIKYRWECHHDSGHGKDRERCNCKGYWTRNLTKVVVQAIIHNWTHNWSGWGYAPMDWSNQTVNIYKRRLGAKNRDLREGNFIEIAYNDERLNKK